METHGMTVIEQNTMEAIQGINRKTPDIHPLTIRDLFAMAALQGLLASKEYATGKAAVAYRYADDMMEARKK